jgi:transcriptional regulator
MYILEQFREERPEVLWAFVSQHPLGALVAVTADGLTANHIPMIWFARDGTPGVLQGHVARANPIWELLDPGATVLVIFSGANQYITPSWYPGMQEHGKVVPTWNYSVVHAHGSIRFDADKSRNHRHVSELSDRQEASREVPWKVTDAPADYIEPMLSRIVSFEIAVTRVVGKFKSSQHRPEDERLAVLAAMAAEGVPARDRDEVIRPPQKP